MKHDYINHTKTQWHKHSIGTIQTPTGERLVLLYIHTYGNIRHKVKVYIKQRGQLVPNQ